MTREQQQHHKLASVVALAMAIAVVTINTSGVDSFSTTTAQSSSMMGRSVAGGVSTSTSTSQLQMGLFDKFVAGGTGRDNLDDEFEKQQKILADRRAPKSERDKYFRKVEKRRNEADSERQQNWGWQTKQYKKGEDPLDEWKKRREDGTIGDIDDQYGDPKKIGGIPFPMPSFGVGGEFGVGGKVSTTVL